MQSIHIKRLIIVNFKGIKQLTIDFKDLHTNIFGANATGKTTIMDAFSWLSHGKNSEGVSQFEIKRLDENNQFVKEVDTEVEAILIIDKKETSIKKVLRQKWVKRRGEISSNYAGDENIYFWNDVPLKESEFKDKIKGIIDENLLKLITSPLYYNSLNWKERRQIIVGLAGEITHNDIFDSIVNADNKGRFNILLDALNSGKTLDEFKKEIAAKKKKIKDEAESIPSRIDEVKRGLPELINFKEIKSQIESFEKEVSAIDKSLNDEVAKLSDEQKVRSEMMKQYNKQISDRQQKVFDLNSKLRNIEFAERQKASEGPSARTAKINSLKNKIEEEKAEWNRLSLGLANLEKNKSEKAVSLDALRDKYIVIDGEIFSFDPSSCKCPTCHQSLPENDIFDKKSSLEESFNKNKLSQLTSLKTQAEQLKNELAELESRVSAGKVKVGNMDGQISNFQSEQEQLEHENNIPQESADASLQQLLEKNTEYQGVKSELEITEQLLITEPVFSPLQTNNELKAKRIEIGNKITELQKELSKEEQLQKGNDRIIELQKQENTLAQELANLEGCEFSIMEFTKAKVDAIEKIINGKFKHVKFKMFDKQVNGGEVECCETLVNSNGSFVPFSDANNAAKINSGIDIINTLSKHYKIQAPIFIDNRESVSNLIESEAQIINLIVSEQDKNLRIS